jgi:hypothetical protein
MARAKRGKGLPVAQSAPRTCIHCVLFRALRYTMQHRPRADVSLCGTAEPCLVPSGPEGAYRLVRRFLNETITDVTATRLRLLAGTRPEIQILAVSSIEGRDQVRTLVLPRYTTDTLARGFTETI